MASAPRFKIDPPLLNSASPWSTTLEDIKALYDTPYTGAVTIRTSLLEGFSHDDAVHQHVFFNSSAKTNIPADTKLGDESAQESSTSKSQTTTTSLSTLNTQGYSPLTLSEYLGIINEIVGQRHLGTDTPTKKPFILSVTGTPDEIAMAYALIANAAEMDEDLRLAMEVNLSCPNIAHAPPPAYDAAQLAEYLEAIGDSKSTYRGRMATPESEPRVGVKLPPYTYAGQFEMVVDALRAAKSSEPGEGSVIDFVTATNTLGSSLLLDAELKPVLNSEAGTGIGGLAGAALHPLALGNVAQLRKLLDAHPETTDVVVIGVGGVEDNAGYERMRKVGAAAVGVASALGRYGVGVFEKITRGA
jgi:dihydroorotate dehydrogenase (fumarate)